MQFHYTSVVPLDFLLVYGPEILSLQNALAEVVFSLFPVSKAKLKWKLVLLIVFLMALLLGVINID